MTSRMRLETNGAYVSEAKDKDGNVVGKAGPGSAVQSDWFWVPHEGVTVAERQATPEEVEASKAEGDTE